MTIGNAISRNQADALGKALRHGELTEDLLTRLNLYRDQVVHDASDAVDALRLLTGYPITPREGKSTPSIVAKLRRQTTSLSQMQDLVGCRIVVDAIVEQESLRFRIVGRFPDAKFVDRRTQPSHGYRAVHCILPWRGRSYEVQIRMRLQHAWAQAVERLSDSKAPGLKYGSGPQDITSLITSLSNSIAKVERFELEVFETRGSLLDEAGELLSAVEGWRSGLIATFEKVLELEWST